MEASGRLDEADVRIADDRVSEDSRRCGGAADRRDPLSGQAVQHGPEILPDPALMEAIGGVQERSVGGKESEGNANRAYVDPQEGMIRAHMAAVTVAEIPAAGQGGGK